jgi:hypothetical protein
VQGELTGEFEGAEITEGNLVDAIASGREVPSTAKEE